MVVKEVLLRQKEKVEILSENAKNSFDFLTQLCNEISIAENLDSGEENIYYMDNLRYILTGRVVEYLTSISSLVAAYKEYSESLEKFIYKTETNEKQPLN